MDAAVSESPNHLTRRPLSRSLCPQQAKERCIRFARMLIWKVIKDQASIALAHELPVYAADSSSGRLLSI